MGVKNRHRTQYDTIGKTSIINCFNWVYSPSLPLSPHIDSLLTDSHSDFCWHTFLILTQNRSTHST